MRCRPSTSSSHPPVCHCPPYHAWLQQFFSRRRVAAARPQTKVVGLSIRRFSWLADYGWAPSPRLLRGKISHALSVSKQGQKMTDIGQIFWLPLRKELACPHPFYRGHHPNLTDSSNAMVNWRYRYVYRNVRDVNNSKICANFFRTLYTCRRICTAHVLSKFIDPFYLGMKYSNSYF